jgi:2-keto-4-pentenoate hydratase/2-oxohepta-3-ene-1,7-dioic acid hydratase in catechol pathway
MQYMRLVTYELEGSLHPGVMAGDSTVVDLGPIGVSSIAELIASGPAMLEKAAKFLNDAPAGAKKPLSSARLVAPIPRPAKLICVGLNYRDHAEETGSEIPEVPTIFNKFATAVIGPGDKIVLPKVSKAPDYEAEFAFVIGRGGRNIAPEKWQDHVFGYTIVNDVSARDYQRATTQWLMGKTFDTFAPVGPWIVTADEIEDPHALDISMTINGEVLQHSNTKNLIFKIPDLISFLSSVFTLEPGDIVSTGTPSGVGMARTPPRFLRAGDTTVVKIQGIGELKNPVVAEQ